MAGSDSAERGERAGEEWKDGGDATAAGPGGELAVAARLGEGRARGEETAAGADGMEAFTRMTGGEAWVDWGGEVWVLEWDGGRVGGWEVTGTREGEAVWSGAVCSGTAGVRMRME